MQTDVFFLFPIHSCPFTIKMQILVLAQALATCTLKNENDHSHHAVKLSTENVQETSPSSFPFSNDLSHLYQNQGPAFSISNGQC